MRENAIRALMPLGRTRQPAVLPSIGVNTQIQHQRSCNDRNGDTSNHGPWAGGFDQDLLPNAGQNLARFTYNSKPFLAGLEMPLTPLFYIRWKTRTRSLPARSACVPMSR